MWELGNCNLRKITFSNDKNPHNRNTYVEISTKGIDEYSVHNIRIRNIVWGNYLLGTYFAQFPLDSDLAKPFAQIFNSSYLNFCQKYFNLF